MVLGGLLSVCGSLQREQFTKQDELVTSLTEVAEKVFVTQLLIHDENTLKIMTVKETIYLIQNIADLYKYGK